LRIVTLWYNETSGQRTVSFDSFRRLKVVTLVDIAFANFKSYFFCRYPSQQIQAQTIVVIHPGSLYLRIGRASDLNPHTLLHVVARRRLPSGSVHHDTFLPKQVPKVGSVTTVW